VPGLVEQLIGRELEVLVLLPAGTPNPRIAQGLVVTLDTVKKHVSHLLVGAVDLKSAAKRVLSRGWPDGSSRCASGPAPLDTAARW
jgi:DNA-binding NarL/FixJ family response regulator